MRVELAAPIGSEVSAAERVESCAQQCLLGRVRCKLQRCFESGGSFIWTAQPQQELATGRMEQVVLRQSKRVDLDERSLWAGQLGDRDGPVESDDRRRRVGEHEVVQF